MDENRTDQNVPRWAEARGWDAERLAAEARCARRFCIRVMAIAFVVSLAFAVVLAVVAVSLQLIPEDPEGWKLILIIVLGPLLCLCFVVSLRKELRDQATPSSAIDGFEIERFVVVLMAGAVIAAQIWAACRAFGL